MFQIDLAEVRTAEGKLSLGKLFLFVAIDSTSKFAVVELVEKSEMQAAAAFLEALVKAVPYRIHTALTDNDIPFADLPKNRQGLTARLRRHPFDRLCQLHGIEHRLTKPNHPWTNGQVERMNRTIKDATVKRSFYDSHNQLKARLTDFLKAYNFARRLKRLKGLTPTNISANSERRTEKIYSQPNPANARTKHLSCSWQGVKENSLKIPEQFDLR